MVRCVKCGIEKVDGDFVVRKSGRLNSWCKKCVRIGARESYSRNREKCIERGKLKNKTLKTFLIIPSLVSQ